MKRRIYKLKELVDDEETNNYLSKCLFLIGPHGHKYFLYIILNSGIYMGIQIPLVNFQLGYSFKVWNVLVRVYIESIM